MSAEYYINFFIIICFLFYVNVKNNFTVIWTTYLIDK